MSDRPACTYSGHHIVVPNVFARLRFRSDSVIFVAMSGVAPSIGFSTSRNNDDETPDYPFCLPSYIPAFDDGLLARQELEPKGPSATWRSERFPAESNVLVLDHNHGQGRQRYCNDAEIVHLLVSTHCGQSLKGEIILLFVRYGPLNFVI